MTEFKSGVVGLVNPIYRGVMGSVLMNSVVGVEINSTFNPKVASQSWEQHWVEVQAVTRDGARVTLYRFDQYAAELDVKIKTVREDFEQALTNLSFKIS